MVFLRRQFLLAFSLSIALSSEGQTPGEPFQVDSAYWRAFQFVSPENARPQTAEGLNDFVFKHYALASLYEEECVKAGLDTSRYIRDELNRILTITRKKYLAQVYSNVLNGRPIEVSDQEALDYYNSHLKSFSRYGWVNLIRVMVAHGTEGGLQQAKRILEEIKKAPPASAEEVKKRDEGGIVVTSDFRLPLSPDQPNTKHLEKARKGDIIGPINGKDVDVLFLILDMEPTVIQPFSAVKESCVSILRGEKKVALLREFERRAKAEFPFEIKADGLVPMK